MHTSVAESIHVQVRPLLKVMKFIGTMYGGKSVAQVALNYLVAKGVKHAHGDNFLLPKIGCST